MIGPYVTLELFSQSYFIDPTSSTPLIEMPFQRKERRETANSPTQHATQHRFWQYIQRYIQQRRIPVKFRTELHFGQTVLHDRGSSGSYTWSKALM